MDCALTLAQSMIDAEAAYRCNFWENAAKRSIELRIGGGDVHAIEPRATEVSRA